MSASREKKTRKDVVAEGYVSPREAQRREQEKKDKRTTTMYIAIIVAMILVFVVSSLYNSESFRKKMTAVTVDGQKYSAAVLDYYYYNAYNSFVNQYGDYLSYFGLDTTKDLDSQSYDESQSWGDYFRDQAVTAITANVSVYNAAVEAGFELPATQQETMDTYLKSISDYCTQTGITMEQYVKDAYGDYVTEDIFNEQLKVSLMAEAYSAYYSESLTYTDDQIKAYYDENPNEIDIVDYSVYTVDGKAESTTDADGNTVEPTDDESAAAMTAAEETANAILSRVDAGEDFKTVAADYDSAQINENNDAAYSSVSTTYADWLFDAARTAGNTTVVKDEEKTCYYVVEFANRSRYDYTSVSVRHILIAPEASALSEGDDGYEADIAKKDAAAKAKADSVLKEYLAGDKTEDSFAALANQYSSDTGSNTTGGLYKNMAKGQMEAAFDAWAYDSSRSAGNTGIVKTNYGYHIMYFVGQGVPYWQAQSENALRTSDYNTWYDETTKNVRESKLGINCIG